MKMFKNIMLATTLFAMNVVDAKQVGSTKARSTGVQSSGAEVQPSRVQEQGLTVQQRQDMLNKQKTEHRAALEKMVQEQDGQNTPSQMSGPVSSKEWREIVRELNSGLPSAQRINEIEQMDLTDDQRTMLSIIEQNILLKRQLVGKTAKEVTEKRQGSRLRGLLSEWWSGEAGDVDSYKNMILAKLYDTERYPTSKEKYPTLKSKQDALKLGIEFFDTVYNDPNIMQKAITIATRVLPKTPDTNPQQRINVLNGKMRKYFKVDLAKLDGLSIEEKIDYLQDYLKKNKAGMKEFVAANITNENVMALLRAIISETDRINMMIASLNSLKAAQEKAQKLAQEANAEQAPISAPQGRPAGGQ